jgi:DNA-binding transcriptional LysR family regulator
MSIDRLRYFAAVVETKNLRKAAELVGISPPSMSKAISILEGELGHKLIHPDGRGIGITPKGVEIYRQSAALLEEYQQFYRRLKESSSGLTQIRMATFEVFSSHFISAFLAAEPAYDFLMLEKTPGKIEQAILDGIADLGLTYLPAPDAALEYREVGAFQMGIFGRKRWSEVSFENWPFAVPITELKIHSSNVDSLDLWPVKAPKRNIKYRFELLETALKTSASGLSVLHCPDFIIRLHNEQAKPSHQLSELQYPAGYKPSKPVKVYLVGRKGAIDSIVERKLAKFIRALKL